MTADPSRDLNLAGAVNLRDLGGYSAGAGRTRWRQLLRSGRLHGLTGDSIDTLCQMGLRTVIDLRHSGEQTRHPNPFQGRAEVELHSVSVFHGLAPAELAQGDAVLPELYRRAIKTRAPQIAKVLQIIADAPQGMVLFHCTAGKDRTGLIAALLLELCGVDRALIAEDYALTAERIAAHIPSMMRDAVSDGMSETRLAPLFNSTPSNITDLLDYLDADFLGVRPYMAQAGVTEDRMRKIAQSLLV